MIDFGKKQKNSEKLSTTGKNLSMSPHDSIIKKTIVIAFNLHKSGFMLDYKLVMRHLDDLIKIKNREYQNERR